MGPLDRLLQLALRLGAGQSVTSGYIRDRYGVSAATAKRDLLRLELALPLVIEEGPLKGLEPQKVLRIAHGCGFTPLLRSAAGV